MWVFEDLDLSLVEALWRTKSQFDNLMLRDKRQRLSTKRQHLAERENTIRHRGDVCGNKLSLKGGYIRHFAGSYLGVSEVSHFAVTPLVCCTILLERSNYDRRSGDNEGVKLE